MNKYLIIIFSFFFLLFSFFFFSCTATPASHLDTAEVPSDVFGVVHGIRQRTEEEYRILEDLGVVWVLTTFNWYRAEPEKNKFDFSDFDIYVNSAKAQNKKIIIVLGFEVPWLYPDGKSKRQVKKEHIPHFLNYTEKTVLHFKDRVDVFSIWNEPNLNRFWKGTDREFFELTKLTAEKIKEISPETYIIGGVFCRTPVNFIKKMHKAGSFEKLDGIAFHPYDINPQRSIKLYDKLLKVLLEAEIDKPIWVTEAGYPTGGMYPTRVSLEKYPSYIVKTLAGFTARGAESVLWYQLYDRHNKDTVSRNTTTSEAFFGLVYPDYELKDGAYAFSLCAQFLPGSDYKKNYLMQKGIPKNIVSYIYMEGDAGFNTLLLWNDNNGTFKALLDIESPAFMHDISTGTKNEISSGTVLEITRKPLFITWKGNNAPSLTGYKQL